MNTLEVINNVLSSLGNPILKDIGQIKNNSNDKELPPITYKIEINPDAVIFKDPAKVKSFNKKVYESPSIEVKEIDNTVLKTPKNEIKKETKKKVEKPSKKIIKPSKSVKSKKATKSIKNK